MQIEDYIEDYIENYDFVKCIKKYIDKSPKTISVFRKHNYVSISGIYKKTELLLCIYCCKLLIILRNEFNNLNYKQYKNFQSYSDFVLSLYLDFFISSWKLCLEKNIDDSDIMDILKIERSPSKFYSKIKFELEK